MKQQEGKLGTKPTEMRLTCLSLDYDGTISPMSTSRAESRIPLQTHIMLREVGRFLPVLIITMKDLSFIVPRTPFAQAWSAIGGLETRIGKRVSKSRHLENMLTSISLSIDYARSHILSAGVEIEEKQDSEGRIIAFCVDWRQAKDLKTAKQEVEYVAAYCKALGLRVLEYETQPYYDVYPVVPDKGEALREILDELGVRNGVLYLGDSEIDNPAFRISSVSLGVIHDEAPSGTLDCNYLVRFESVPEFLHALLLNDLRFTPDFPMIKINPNRRRELTQ